MNITHFTTLILYGLMAVDVGDEEQTCLHFQNAGIYTSLLDGSSVFRFPVFRIPRRKQPVKARRR